MKQSRIEEVVAEVGPSTVRLAGTALIAIIALAGFLYVLKPVWKEAQDLRGTHSDVLEAAAGGGHNASDGLIAQLESETEKLRDDLYGGAANIPRSEIESFIIDSLNRISERHGVRLDGITPDQPASILMFEELPYTVEVSGSYFSVHQWLYYVEEELRPMVVKRFELQPSRTRDMVNLNLRIVAYRSSKGATG